MTDVLVIDASVAVKWFVAEDGSDLAENLLGRVGILHAPDLLRIELGNAFRKNVRREMIDEEQALEGLARVGRTITRWHQIEALVPRALAWAIQYDHPIYDFCYLALGQSVGAPVVTADAAFLRKLAGKPEERHVISLSEFA